MEKRMIVQVEGNERAKAKERKQKRGMENFSKFNLSRGNRKFSTPPRVTEDSVAKREDIRRLLCL